MALKSWRLKTSQNDGFGNGADDIALSVLRARGISDEAEAFEFLDGQGELYDPFELKDMDKAVARINEAVENGEGIAVYGDYDCDGITSTAVMYTYLESMGADVCYYIPERSAGYGLNRNAIDELANRGVSLVITVDNGISALDESEYLKTLGIDLIVTDHHQPGDVLPQACAVVDPHRKDCTSRFKDLCGAGVALKLVAALEGGDYFTAIDYYADLVAIGTVADVVPLVCENRTIVKSGVEALSVTENIGLNALIASAGLADKEIKSENIAYGIAPRLNAAGRMGSANIAMQLILSEDEEQALSLCEKINELNLLRKSEEAKILDEIERQIAQNPQIVNDRVIVLSGSGWHQGVIGIVSARITEKYAKPSAIISVNGQNATGSARSFGDFSLFKAIESTAHLLTKFGGHSGAAGFSLSPDKIDEFRKSINEYAKENFPAMPKMAIDIDSKISSGDITLENARELVKLEPFGEANPKPVFLLENAIVDMVYSIGNDKHSRVRFTQNGNTFFALLFGVPANEFEYSAGIITDILITLDENEYNGKSSVSVKLRDIRPHGFDESRYFAAKDAFESAMRQESIDKRLYSRLAPTREETAFIYRYLISRSGKKIKADNIFTALYKTKMNFGKILSVLIILQEVGIAQSGFVFDGVTLAKTQGKKNLDDSRFLKYLKSNQ